ncbi:hypothetical protein SLEP1_g22449 [Rubroshorea leprosula]|uniref:B box-type domain-containing protein n=1 Tax=Rubroshorea leprosula TaxID=152421 RepID=A0AAV5JFC3_9ROSI|nr:hypothetical protein SLEP1_g22449 [Rubroshorea leprosula]
MLSASAQKGMGKILGTKRLHASKTHENLAVVPPWLTVMYSTVFFSACILHPEEKKNELDRFCIDCLQSFCSHCLPAHAVHKNFKIRRYIYSDVINRQDLCKLFNCSGIQTYLTNKAKVLFLKQRTHPCQQQQSNSKDYSCYCIVCDKSLQDISSLYCSIACKVKAIHEDEQREETRANGNPLLRSLKGEGRYLPLLPALKSKKIKHTRKGVPVRAPMF